MHEAMIRSGTCQPHDNDGQEHLVDEPRMHFRQLNTEGLLGGSLS